MDLLVVLVFAVVVLLPIVAIIVAIRADATAREARAGSRDLRTHVTRLRQTMRALETRVAALGGEEGPPATPTEAEDPASSEGLPPVAEVASARPVRETIAPGPADVPRVPTGEAVAPVEAESPAERPTPSPSTASPEKAAARPTLEARIGGRWFNWIGIVALLLGTGFLIKYAHEEGWISPHLQLHGGIVVGLMMLAAGHLAARRGYDVPARGFWGGGIGILYLVLFAGYRVYGILDAWTAFAGMVATTVLGAALAIWHDAKSVIVLAAIGGYLTPVLLGSEEPNQVFLFTYLSILSAGLLFVGFWRSWRFLNPLSLVAVLAYFGAWWTGHGPGDPILSVIYVSVFLVLFTSEITAWSVRRREVGDAWTRFTLVLVVVLHGVAGVVLLRQHAPASVGIFLLATAAWHGLNARLIHRFHREDAVNARLFGSAAATFLLLFPVLEESLHGYQIGMVWAVEALLILATASWGGGWSRAWAILAILLAGTRLALYDTPKELLSMEPYVPFLTTRGLAYAVVIGAFVVVSLVLGRRERVRWVAPAVASGGTNEERRAAWAELEHLATTIVWILAVGLPLLLLSLELSDAFVRYVKPAFAGREDVYTRSENHWMTVLWAVYTALVLTVARRRGSMLFVRVGLVAGAAILWKLGAIDVGHLYLPAATPFLNARFAVLGVVAASLFFTAREFRRPGPERTTMPELASLLLVLGHAASLTAVALEWFDFFHARDLGPAMAHADVLGTAAWAALYGLGLVLYVTRRGGGRVLLGTGVTFLVLAVTAYVVLAGFVFHDVASRPLGTFRFFAGVVVAASAFASARAIRRAGLAPAQGAARVDGWLLALGHAATVTLLSLEAWDLFAARADAWTPASAISVIGGSGFAWTAVWAVYGALLLGYGIRRSRFLSRGLALLLIGGSLLGVAFLCLSPTTGRSLHVLLDTRFLLGGLTALALFLGAEAYHRRGADLVNARPVGGRREDLALRPTLALLGHALMLLLLTLEARDHFAVRGDDAVHGLDVAHATQLSYSAIWALYAIGMVVVGFVRNFRPVRLMALAILLATILKVFLFDLSFLENPYRIISFILLGLILVGVSFLYTRYKDYLVGDLPDEAGGGKGEDGSGVESTGSVD